MTPIFQTDYSKKTGNCLQACIASIFDLNMFEVPNLLEQTQDAPELWRLLSEWCEKKLNCKSVLIEVSAESEFLIANLLCVAIGKAKVSGQDHAVVWCNNVVHDPSLGGKGFINKPTTFLVFCPLRPKAGK